MWINANKLGSMPVQYSSQTLTVINIEHISLHYITLHYITFIWCFYLKGLLKHPTEAAWWSWVSNSLLCGQCLNWWANTEHVVEKHDHYINRAIIRSMKDYKLRCSVVQTQNRIFSVISISQPWHLPHSSRTDALEDSEMSIGCN